MSGYLCEAVVSNKPKPMRAGHHKRPKQINQIYIYTRARAHTHTHTHTHIGYIQPIILYVCTTKIIGY